MAQKPLYGIPSPSALGSSLVALGYPPATRELVAPKYWVRWVPRLFVNGLLYLGEGYGWLGRASHLYNNPTLHP